jgi:hypothetical protein
MSRCRRYHPVWLTHTQIGLLMSLCADQERDGSYWGNREEFEKRLEDCTAALFVADDNCIDEMERPKR